MSDRSGPSETLRWLGGDVDEALEFVHVPAWILDRSGIVRWENARALELFGDRRGRPFAEAVPAEHVQQARLNFAEHMLGPDRMSNARGAVRTKSGGVVPVEIRAVRLESGGRVVGVFGMSYVDDESDHSPRPVRGSLTPRQQQVLDALADGYSTAQMAEAFHVSNETVRNHVRAVLRILGVHSRLEAVVEARRRGMLQKP